MPNIMGLLTIELIKLCYQIWAYKCEKVIHYRRMLFFILEENVGMAMAMQKTQGCWQTKEHTWSIHYYD